MWICVVRTIHCNDIKEKKKNGLYAVGQKNGLKSYTMKKENRTEF